MNKLKIIVGHNIFLLVSALDVSGLIVRVIDGGIKLPQDVLAFAMFGALMLLVVSALLDKELTKDNSTQKDVKPTGVHLSSVVRGNKR
ncbi:hypothetical protein [Pediococcus pentosaceus]|uniref:hypothetical protein n=1 Tax=Pediococcus pentosaceus TaxID=1255 RepID=UPI0039820CDF